MLRVYWWINIMTYNSSLTKLPISPNRKETLKLSDGRSVDSLERLILTSPSQLSILHLLDGVDFLCVRDPLLFPWHILAIRLFFILHKSVLIKACFHHAVLWNLPCSFQWFAQVSLSLDTNRHQGFINFHDFLFTHFSTISCSLWRCAGFLTYFIKLFLQRSLCSFGSNQLCSLQLSPGSVPKQ